MSTIIKTGIWLASLLLVPLASIAEAVDQEPIQSIAPVGVPSVLGFGASLVLVIATILLVGWLYSRMQGGVVGTSNVINILASQSLGSKEKIVLVEVGSKQIVVGMTSSNLQTLHVFDEPVVSGAERSSNSAFAERLLTAIKGAAK